MDEEFRSELIARREKLSGILRDGAMENKKGDALLLFSAPVFLRNGDVEHSYRQHSDFFYLSGLEEPESALLLLPEEPRFVLFVRERDREKEIWEGRRAGTLGARESFGAVESHPISSLSEKLPDYLENRRRLHYLFGEQEEWDKVVFRAISDVRRRRRKRVDAPTTLVDARSILHEARLLKSPYEQARMANVGRVSAHAHRAAMVAARPGMKEWELQNVVESAFRAAGARRVAYDSIVGSGDNGTILHYRENDRDMQAGDLVLIDAGAELDYLAADITRTFPVGGTFSPVQKRLYEIVLRSQAAAIEKTVVGSTLEEIHEAARAILEEGLSAEGLLDGEEHQEVEARKKRVAHFYMHRTSHYLGMDVHDVGPYHSGGELRRMEAGMVITVEPGLYIAADDESVPLEYRGIGIRIEDDILVTSEGPTNLTGAAPKTVEEIEAACAENGAGVANLTA
jgi:Xaa-Pro aminopeptidase